MYAFFKKLDYFSTECIYAPYAARGAAREFVKDLEVIILALPLMLWFWSSYQRAWLATTSVAECDNFRTLYYLLDRARVSCQPVYRCPKHLHCCYGASQAMA